MALVLTSDAIRNFREQGFLVIPEICPAQEVDRLCGVYDRLFAERVGWDKGDFFDFAGPDTPGSVPVLPQLLAPSRYEPSLKNTIFRTNALAVARQLLGRSTKLVYEHAMLKPARIGAETPWHQDEAFFRIYTDYQSITIWMPLQPVDLSNGCMEFIAGSHTGPVVPHRRLNDDPRLQALEAYGVDLSRPVSCPLPAGAAVVHHCRTLHHAGPNLTDGPRRAYALAYGVCSREFMLRADFPWNVTQATAQSKRADEAQGAIRRGISQLRRGVRAIIR